MSRAGSDATEIEAGAGGSSSNNKRGCWTSARAIKASFDVHRRCCCIPASCRQRCKNAQLFQLFVAFRAFLLTGERKKAYGGGQPINTISSTLKSKMPSGTRHPCNSVFCAALAMAECLHREAIQQDLAFNNGITKNGAHECGFAATIGSLTDNKLFRDRVWGHTSRSTGWRSNPETHDGRQAKSPATRVTTSKQEKRCTNKSGQNAKWDFSLFQCVAPAYR